MDHKFLIAITQNQPLYEGDYLYLEYCLSINSEENNIAFRVDISAFEKEIKSLIKSIKKRESTHIVLRDDLYYSSFDIVILAVDFSKNKFTWSYSYQHDHCNMEGEDKYKLKEEIPLSKSFYFHLLSLLEKIILK